MMRAILRYKTIIIPVFLVTSMLTPAIYGENQGLHEPWDQLLKKYVKNGVVDYKGFLSSEKELDHYLANLEAVDLAGSTPQQKLAFWINAYNAFTVKLILNHYPTDSIRDIKRPWKRRVWKADGRTLSLDDIEHKILRNVFEEPRIHFAIVCASIGCPDLMPFAYLGEKIEEQLKYVSRKFFSSSKHFQAKKDGKRIVIKISKIFRWFGKDFGDKKSQWVTFMMPYLDDSTAGILKNATSIKFKYLSYDWNLNGKN